MLKVKRPSLLHHKVSAARRAMTANL